MVRIGKAWFRVIESWHMTVEITITAVATAAEIATVEKPATVDRLDTLLAERQNEQDKYPGYAKLICIEGDLLAAIVADVKALKAGQCE